MQIVKTEQLGHLGLIAAVIKKLNIIEKIDLKLPVSKEHGSIVTMGQRVAAMILNGLGFLNDRLYMHSIFFEDKPVAALLGENITSEHLNDDALGRALDSIYDYGTTKLFAELAFEIAAEHQLLGKTAKLDTTTISLYGEYEDCDLEQDINITHGYAKNKRFDLKQVVLSLTNSGQGGHPLWMEPLNGNSSDKENFHNTIDKINAFKQQLTTAPDFIYVADSALYTKDKLLAAPNLRWITRVPESIKEARTLVEKNDSEFQWNILSDGYKFHELISQYGEITQRWQIIYSEQAFKRETKSLTKRILKEQEKLKKILWHLENKKFTCEDDAATAINPLNKGLKYHTIFSEIKPISKYFKKGRPSSEETTTVIGYQIVSVIHENVELIKKATNRLGRFILATNELEQDMLPSNKILEEYKELNKVEKGFRFIKSTEFSISSIFLKLP
jgi:transposase